MSTARERNLVVALVLMLLIGGGYLLGNVLFLQPLARKKDQLAALDKEIMDKQLKIAQANANRRKMQAWKVASLPPDVDLSQREYEKFLTDLARKSGARGGDFSVIPPRQLDTKSSPTIPGKGAIYTKLPFTIQGHGSVPMIVKLLEGFHRAPLLHQIKNINLQRPLTPSPQQKPNEVDFRLNIEALVISDAKPRKTLLSETKTADKGDGPVFQVSLAEAGREYLSIPEKNVFFGPSDRPKTVEPNWEVLRFVHLTDITTNERRTEAFLYDRYNNQRTRLRASVGFDSFRIRDAAGEELVAGKVMRIDERDVIFEAEEKFFKLHIGQSLEEAMRKPMTSAENAYKFLDGIGLGPLW
jgi:hypothetical protein